MDDFGNTLARAQVTLINWAFAFLAIFLGGLFIVLSAPYYMIRYLLREDDI